MRPLLRRARLSGATRLIWTGVLATMLAVPAAGAGAGPSEFVAQAACSGSTVTREYTPESMTLRLHLDLEGCRWWDGSARNLMIWVSRDDGAGPASRYSMMACEAGSDPQSSRPTACEVFATLPHPADEDAVTYQGEATWEWKDGTRRVSFDTRCTTAAGQAGCEDPVATWHD